MGVSMFRAGFSVLVVLGFVLGDFGVCNGGMTSEFVRDDDVSSDMPLDSDVFRPPPGRNAAQQVIFVSLCCFFAPFLILLLDFSFCI